MKTCCGTRVSFRNCCSLSLGYSFFVIPISDPEYKKPAAVPEVVPMMSKITQHKLKEAPTINHWAVVEHILCYLKGALERGILYKKHGHTRIECFSDANWAGSNKYRRSTSGYYVFFEGNMISWKSKKQSVVS